MLKEIDEHRLRAVRAYRNAITHLIIFWAVPAFDKSNCRKSSGRNTIVWCTTTIINHIVWEKQSWLAKKKNLFLFIRKNFYEIPLPSPSIVRSSIFLAKFFISRFLSVVLLPLIYPFIRYYLAIILIFYVSKSFYFVLPFTYRVVNPFNFSIFPCPFYLSCHLFSIE